MTTLKTVIVIFTSGSLLGLAGCALHARTDSDPRVSVAACHSFSFADGGMHRPEAASAFGNPLNEKRLREAIAANLGSRGLPVAAESAAADCTVGYAIGSRLAPDPAEPRVSWGMGWGGWGRHGLGGAVAWSGPYDYREGRVTVDLYDARSHEALWHAYVDEDVTRLTGAGAEQRIKAVVTAIFEKFPAAMTTAPAAGATKS
jgi:hypothetical protein